MSASRVTIVSDTHLSTFAPEADANWDAVLRYIDSAQPDLVIHVGDLSLDGANRVEDLHHARRHLERLTVPWVAVPGNHDIGDNPTSDKPKEAVTSQRNERWREIVGDDRWSIELDGWLLVGINAQLFGSGLDEEADQWTFLEAELERRGHGSTILILHKPAGVTDAELQTAHPHRYVPDPARQRLMDLVDEDHVPLVVSGHVHQYRRLDLNGAHHLWAPTTWAVLPEEIQATIGLKRSGVVQLTLEADGSWDAQRVEPEGLRQIMGLRDIPNRYPDH